MTTTPRTRLPFVIAAALLAAVGLAVAGAGAAAAHVTVTSSTAVTGAWATLTFTVPVESPTANTTEFTVQLPKDAPFASVRAQPVPGWTATLTSTKLERSVKDDDGNAITSAITRVGWKADGVGLRPGEFGQFSLSVGPLPKPGTLYLPAVQAYSDGSEVDWVQRAQGGAEPEHPAPSIDVVSATAAARPGAAAQTSKDAVTVAASPDTRTTDGWVIAFGAASLVIALAASAVAALALARTRR